jgi:hypothetical protein
MIAAMSCPDASAIELRAGKAAATGGSGTITLPLPNSDTGYWQLDSTVTATGSPTFTSSITARSIEITSTTDNYGIKVTSFDAKPGFYYAIYSTGPVPQYEFGYTSTTFRGTTVYILNGPLLLGNTMAVTVANISGVHRPLFRFGTGVSQINTNNLTGASNVQGIIEAIPDPSRWVWFKFGGPIGGITLNLGSSLMEFGTYNSNSLRLITNNTAAAVWDTSQNMTNSGVIRVANGTVAAPALSFTNCTSCGQWQEGSPINAIKMSAGATGRESQAWWSTGEVSFGRVGGSLSGTSNAPPANVWITTSATPNKDLIGIATGTTANPLKLFRQDTSSTTVGNPFFVINSSINAQSMMVSSYSMVVTTTSRHTKDISLSVSTYGYVNMVSSSNIHSLGSCGTSTIYGGGNAFAIIAAGGANGCTVTFAKPFKNPPIVNICQRNFSLANSLAYTVTNESLTITQTSMGSLDVILVGAD